MLTPFTSVNDELLFKLMLLACDTHSLTHVFLQVAAAPHLPPALLLAAPPPLLPPPPQSLPAARRSCRQVTSRRPLFNAPATAARCRQSYRFLQPSSSAEAARRTYT